MAKHMCLLGYWYRNKGVFKEIIIPSRHTDAQLFLVISRGNLESDSDC